MNIGRGDDISIGELVERIGQLMGKTIEVQTETDRVRPSSSEVERLLAGTALAQSLWSWKPRYTLDQGLEETIAWVREHISRLPNGELHDLKIPEPSGFQRRLRRDSTCVRGLLETRVPSAEQEHGCSPWSEAVAEGFANPRRQTLRALPTGGEANPMLPHE